MANVPISNMTVTWTDSGTTYNAVKMNVTDTASNAASNLMDLQVGGTSQFKVSKIGDITIPNTGAVLSPSGGVVQIGGNTRSTTGAAGVSNGLRIGGVATLNFANSLYNTSDLYLVRDAADTLAQRNATNPQTFNIYNTYTNASNYERVSFGWSGNTFTIGRESAGTGVTRPINIVGGTGVLGIGSAATGAVSWTILNNNILAGADNTYDIGASGANRPRYLYLGGGSLTGTAADSSVTISPTWNTTGTPTAVLLNVTDTASNAASLLMDLRVGGVSKFKVDKTGRVSSGYGYVYAKPQFYDNSIGEAAGFQITNSSSCTIFASSTAILNIDATATNGVRLASTTSLGWANGHALSSSSDTTFHRDAADTVAQRRATNPQTFRVYNTYTDASNYERGFVQYSANVLQIGHEAAGTGNTGRSVALLAGGTNYFSIGGGTGVWLINTSGHLLCTADNTRDIGASGANRPRNVYIAGTADVGNGNLSLSSDVRLSRRSSGVLLLDNNGGTDFGRLQFGGTTSSFPALKRNSTALETKLADDSAYAPHAMQYLDVTDGVTAPGAATGRARIYVDTADGDLKVVFADGTVKTIVTDT